MQGCLSIEYMYIYLGLTVSDLKCSLLVTSTGVRHRALMVLLMRTIQAIARRIIAPKRAEVFFVGIHQSFLARKFRICRAKATFQ